MGGKCCGGVGIASVKLVIEIAITVSEYGGLAIFELVFGVVFYWGVVFTVKAVYVYFGADFTTG